MPAMTSHLNGQLELAYGQTQLHQIARLSDITHHTAPASGGSPSPGAAFRTIELIAAPIPSRGRSIGRILAAVALAITGVGLAVVTAGATVAFSYDSAGSLMSGLAAASDATAMLTPAAACTLWKARRWLLAMTAWAMWAAASCICLSNLSGFIGAHSDQFFGGRETASIQRGIILDQIARLRSERANISESRSIGEVTAAINNSKASKIDAERMALQTARHRDEIDRQLVGLEPQIACLPAVSTVDPSASVLSDALHVPAVDLRRIRLCLLLGLPLCGGLLIAMAAALGSAKERAP
jgi:hypothetical protein